MLNSIKFLLYGAAIGFLVILYSFDSPSKYELLITKGQLFKVKDTTFIIVPVKLKNNTRDTLRYASMACSWRGFYEIDSKSVEWGEAIPECLRDGPLLLKIRPHGESIIKLKLRVRSVPKNSIITYRIGFNLLIDNDNWYPMALIKHQKIKDNYLWSNQIRRTVAYQ